MVGSHPADRRRAALTHGVRGRAALHQRDRLGRAAVVLYLVESGSDVLQVGGAEDGLVVGDDPPERQLVVVYDASATHLVPIGDLQTRDGHAGVRLLVNLNTRSCR